MEQDNTKPKLHPLTLSQGDLVQLLSKVSGKPVTSGMIEADLAAGAPSNADGTLNLVHYAAWLLKEMHRGP